MTKKELAEMKQEILEEKNLCKPVTIYIDKDKYYLKINRKYRSTIPKLFKKYYEIRSC